MYPSGRTRRFDLACDFCGVLLDAASDPDIGLDHLSRALAGPVFALDEDAPYGLDAYTLRMAATRWSRASVPSDAAQRAALRAPHDERAATALLEDLETFGSDSHPDISLGILCRPGEVDALVRASRPHSSWAREVVLLVDAPAASSEADGTVRIVARPMDGDFAAQRNALQDLAKAPWMMQLDADESLGAASADILRPLAALATRGGAVSVGLARRNLVDGVLSDLYPDTQYRLNRREVRFAGRVHERPVRDWRQSLTALCGAIDHHLTKDRVETRSTAYEAMAPGEGRLDEASALLRPFAS